MSWEQYKCVCTKEEREKIKLLSSRLKLDSKERVAEVIVRALEKLNGGKK